MIIVFIKYFLISKHNYNKFKIEVTLVSFFPPKLQYLIDFVQVLIIQPKRERRCKITHITTGVPIKAVTEFKGKTV